MSKKRNKKRNKKRIRKPQPQELKLFEHPFNEIDKDILKEALIAQAKADEENFPVLLDSLLNNLRTYYPPSIIAILATYGMQSVSDKGISSKAMVTKIHQSHIEILQALTLTIPYSEWGSHPPIPEVIQKIIDQTNELAEAFRFRRFSILSEERDEQQRPLLLLQERMRGHTQIVRNWGYFSAVVNISKELYSPLDQDFSDHFGFSATDLIDVSKELISVLEKRVTQRVNILQRILKSRTKAKMVKNYYVEFPNLKDDPETFLAAIPAGVTKKMLSYLILGHTEISLYKLSIVDVDEISKSTNRAKSVVENILNKLSRYPSDLEATQIERFFLDNPIWTAPGIRFSDRFFFPAPQIVFSNIHPIMNLLMDEAKIKTKLERRRAVFLETKVKEIVKKALPRIKLTASAKWELDGNVYETDLLGMIDRVVLIVESKSASLTPQGLRGAPDRVRRHVRDLIVEPARQSQRLEKVIMQAKEKKPASLDIMSSLELNPDDIDTVIRISVTLDDFSTLCSAEKELKEAGWVDQDLQLPTTLNIADFEVIADILDEPAHFLHYFAERERIQKTTHILGDELDYLGLYLKTGFNISPLENSDVSLIATGLSKPIDHYYNSKDAGVITEKPRPKIHPQLAKIIRMVRERNATAWTTMSLDLLRMGNIDEQKILFSKLEALRTSVRKNYQNPEHLSSLIISPPDHREACVLFYVYPDALSSDRRNVVAQLSVEACARGNWKRCTFIGKKIEEWDTPYRFAGLYQP